MQGNRPRAQFNLLPEVKLQYLRIARTRHMVIIGSIIIVGVVSLFLVSIITAVMGFQRTHLNNLSADIREESAKLESTEDLNKVLTVQNQLTRLTSLHEEKPHTSRLLDYLAKMTPTNVTLSKVTYDETRQIIELQGDADSVASVNQFVDTIKFATYEYTDDSTEDTEIVEASAFSQVVLDSFSISEDGVSYAINLMYDPVLFDNTISPELQIPAIVTTRSETEKPSLFKIQEQQEDQ